MSDDSAESDIVYYKESQVLKPSPEDILSGDFPTFFLYDATVYDRDGNVANLLDVYHDGPFVVRGRLQIEKDGRESLIKDHVRSANIEIAKCYGCCIGISTNEEGVADVWASGLAGWFTIKPSPEYTATYDKMVEGIYLYYHILSAYEESKRLKQRHPPKLNDILLKVGPVPDIPWLFKEPCAPNPRRPSDSPAIARCCPRRWIHHGRHASPVQGACQTPVHPGSEGKRIRLGQNAISPMVSEGIPSEY